MKTAYQQILSAEPRFGVVQRELTALLRLVDLEVDGQVVRPTGFRLKDLPRWRTMRADNPLDALGALSGTCNCQCAFCFERGHPFPQDKTILSKQEAMTRLRYYDAGSGAALFPSNRVYKETFVNPDALSILSEARMVSPEQVFWLTSNGSALTEPMVRRLSALKPLMLKLSLNSVSWQTRTTLMGKQSHPEIALAAPAMLCHHRIPFIGSVVVWPPLCREGLSGTLGFLDQFAPYALRVRLPVYHRFLHPSPPFSPDLWDLAVDICRELQPTLKSPLYVEPFAYWIPPIIPVVDGVIRRSPAAEAGVRTGDRIISINGEAVLTRSQAQGLLTAAHRQSDAPVRLALQRGSEPGERNVTLDVGTASYPYSPEVHANGERYGIYLLDDFRLGYLQRIMSLMSEHGSRCAMLFTSPVFKPIAQTIIDTLEPFKTFFRTCSLELECIEETVAGGNYHLMDARLVADIIGQIERAALRLGRHPDLILIPAAFGNPWGIDFLQRSYKDIERRFDTPVALVNWPILYGRDV